MSGGCKPGSVQHFGELSSVWYSTVEWEGCLISGSVRRGSERAVALLCVLLSEALRGYRLRLVFEGHG